MTNDPVAVIGDYVIASAAVNTRFLNSLEILMCAEYLALAHYGIPLTLIYLSDASVYFNPDTGFAIKNGFCQEFVPIFESGAFYDGIRLGGYHADENFWMGLDWL